MLHVFVYGTLKVGGRNHAAYCPTLHSWQPAWTWGRLYDLPEGYPALTAPLPTPPRTGSRRYTTDAHLSGQPVGPMPPRPKGHWDRVTGQLFQFENSDALKLLDELEEYYPDGGPSLYTRQHLPVWAMGAMDKAIWAWAYVMDSPPGIYLPDGTWNS